MLVAAGKTNSHWWCRAHSLGKPADSRADLGESALSGGPRHLARRQEDSAAGWGTLMQDHTLTHSYPEDKQLEELNISSWKLRPWSNFHNFRQSCRNARSRSTACAQCRLRLGVCVCVCVCVCARVCTTSRDRMRAVIQGQTDNLPARWCPCLCCCLIFSRLQPPVLTPSASIITLCSNSSKIEFTKWYLFKRSESSSGKTAEFLLKLQKQKLLFRPSSFCGVILYTTLMHLQLALLLSRRDGQQRRVLADKTIAAKHRDHAVIHNINHTPSAKSVGVMGGKLFVCWWVMTLLVCTEHKNVIKDLFILIRNCSCFRFGSYT